MSRIWLASEDMKEKTSDDLNALKKKDLGAESSNKKLSIVDAH